MTRADVERLLEGVSWAWSAGLSALLDEAVLEEERAIIAEERGT